MRRGLAGIGKVAIAIEINESADTCRACTEVGRVDAHRLCTELHIGEIRHDHAVFIVAEQIIAIGIHARLAIGFIVDARTHEQAGHDVMHRSAIRNQGLVVAGANSGTGIGQVTEINATHTDHVILDFAITGQAADHAVTGGIRAQAEAREGRTAWRIQRLGERQLEHDVRAAARNRDRTDLDAWSEIAVLVEIDESAKPGINSGQVGRGDVHRAGLADNEHQAGGVDAILIVDTYHHIGNRVAYFSAIKAKMKPGAKLAIVDFKKDAAVEGPPKEFRFTPEQISGELAQAAPEYRVAAQRRRRRARGVRGMTPGHRARSGPAARGHMR